MRRVDVNSSAATRRVSCHCFAAKVIGMDELYDLAVAAYDEHADYKARERCHTLTPSFVDRISVNYIRHRLTRYDAEMDRLTRTVGAADHRLRLQERVFEAIAEAYPDLADECDRQYLNSIDRRYSV